MTTLVLSILNGSSSFLHTIRTTNKAWVSLNYVKIPLHILELAPLQHLKAAYSVTMNIFRKKIVSF